MDMALERFESALVATDRVAAGAIFEAAVAERSPLDVVERLVVPALLNIGQAWNDGEVALSQVYMSGRFCEELVDTVLPPSDPDRKHQPRSAIVVLSDHHDLGKRIVYSVMRASGFEIFDYRRMDVDELVARAQADRIRVLLISVLMLPSALKVRQVCDRLKQGPNPVKVVVGGAPFLFDAQLWREVGADAMGATAAEAVTLVESLMRELT